MSRSFSSMDFMGLLLSSYIIDRIFNSFTLVLLTYFWLGLGLGLAISRIAHFEYDKTPLLSTGENKKSGPSATWLCQHTESNK